MSEIRNVYLDHSATTPMNKEVLDAMIPHFIEGYGNASSIYLVGRNARTAIDKSRDLVAAAIGCLSREVYFTGSGTEADNWAIRGIVMANKNKGKHIITTKIEHPAVLETCKDLQKQGCEVTYLPVDENGFVTAAQVESAIRPDTILVTIMMANNEIGTIEPISDIGAVCRAKGVVFHTDAVQAIGQFPIDVVKMNIDLLSLSGHKFYGPKGTGALYIRKGIKISSFITGGHQESGKRASTENVPGIVGLGKAIEIATTNIEAKAEKLRFLRDMIISRVFNEIPFVRLNGDRYNRLPGHVNISFRYVEGESLLLMLDMNGIAASSGSACTSGSLDPSHVLLSIGLPHEIAHGSLRFTLGTENNEDDVNYLIDKLKIIVQKLRDMSPLYKVVEEKR